MARLETVCINCTVSVGGTSVSTPYIKSFSVNRSRGQQGTASASLKVKGSIGAAGGGSFSISCNTNGVVFTGTVVKASVSPCFDDPSYVIVNVEAEDAWRELTGKKFTRRCRTRLSRWAAIEGTRAGLRSTGFQKQKAKESSIGGGRLDKERRGVANRTISVWDHSELPKSSTGLIPREISLSFSLTPDA